MEMSEVEYNKQSAALSILGVALDDPKQHTTKVPFKGGTFEVSAAGVVFIPKDGDPRRVCGELRALAKTRDAHGTGWGLLLSWNDADLLPHKWAMPMELLHGEPSEVTKALAAGGLHIEPGATTNLRNYLQACQPDERLRCVERLGWQESAYCLSNETIGNNQGEHVTFQGIGLVSSAHARHGSAESWRDSVANLAIGNSRLVFAICCAFAGPLLKLTGEESGGFHFVGQSSAGKTTALKVAASVWGPPDKFVRQWRATANALEGLAALHNDGLLILDELSQCDPKQASEAAYMLANGMGKARASRTGGARESAWWRILFLSSGEVPLSALMEGVGKRVNAGQELRLANIPADAGAGLGMFNRLHHCESPAAFATAVKEASASAYGAVGPDFVRQLVKMFDVLPTILTEGIQNFTREAVPEAASGQVQRVARRFALISAAGQLATAFGLTGWDEAEANAGVRECFNSWLEGYGAGNHEDKAILEQVRTFIEKHGASRFQKWDAENVPVHNRAGFWKEEGGGARQYLVPSATFKSEVVNGFDSRRAAKILAAHGMIIPGPDRLQTKQRLPGMDSCWVYVIVIPEEA